MFTSHTLMIGFTIVFAVTGLYSSVRFAGLVSGAAPDGDRVAELTHLLMSLAMIAMTWAFTGGPDTASGVLQIVVFGLLGLWFLVQLAGPGHGHGRSTAGYHLVMAGAMVWMVAAMPVLMGGSGMHTDMSVGGGSHGDHASMAGMGMTGVRSAHAVGGMGTNGVDGPPTWARVITLAFVVLLVAAMAMWSSRLLRRRATPQISPPEARSAGPASAAATAIVNRPAATGLAQLTGPRPDAACHLLMSLGMAAALLAML